MSADQRYMYQTPQDMSSSYEYSYPAPSYEQAPQAPVRSLRPNSQSQSQSHSPHQQMTFGSSPSYQQPASYAPAPYPPSQTSQSGQWTSEQWSQYSQPFPSQMEPSYSASSGRPEGAPPASSSEQRGYGHGPQSSQSNSDYRRNEERFEPAMPPSNTPEEIKNRRRDKNTPPNSNVPPSGYALDFTKIMDSYRFVIDASTTLLSSGVPPPSRISPAETIDRMLQSANYGLQLLEFSHSNPNTVSKSSAEQEAEEDRDSGFAAKRMKAEDQVPEGQMCLGCNATSTPEWRRGPMGPRTLCNACGLVYAKLIKKRVREIGRARAGVNGRQDPESQNAVDESGLASSGEGASDDDGSYGSQDHRSDGDQGRRN